MAGAPTTISCPACNKRFKGKPELAGKKIKCPVCGVPFVVPAIDDDATIQLADDAIQPAKPRPPVKAAPKPVMAPAAPAPAPEPAEDAAYGLGEIDISAKCPNCAKPMANETAVICVYCGYNTLTREHGKTKKVYAVTPLEHFLYLLPALSAAGAFLAIVLFIAFYNAVVPDWVVGKSWDWIASEPMRMWPAMILLVPLWGLGYYAFNTLVLRPRPPEIEKE